MQNEISGVYKITNLLNNKIYIGSSQNIHRRFEEHIRALNNKYHENKYLQNSWDKYGKNNFKFEIIEIVEKQKLLEVEQVYLDKYLCYEEKNGYNIAKYASAPMRGKKHSPESIQKQIKNQSGKNHWSYGKPKTTRENISLAKGGLNKELETLLIDEYLKNNKKIKEILVKYDISKTSFHRILKRHNILEKRKIVKINEDTIKAVQKDFLNGISRKQIREKYKLKKTTVYNITKNLL